MSVWTHVYGMVQGYVPENTTEEDIKKVIGVMRVWDDFVEKNIVTSQEWKEAFDKTKNPIPMGSEGSMEYVIGFRESEDYGKTAIISFFGNLRDYGGDEDLRGLLKWFMSIFDFVFAPKAYINIEDYWNQTVWSYENYSQLFNPHGEKNEDKYAFARHAYHRDKSFSTEIVRISGDGSVKEIGLEK